MNVPKRTLILIGLTSLAGAEPLIDSWHTADSGGYARIWATLAQETTERGGGATTSLTTWDSADYDGVTVGDQTEPVYAGVQGVSYSDDYVYIKATGLATNTMGPWFLNAARTAEFPSFPGNAAILYQFPRTTDYPVDYNPATRSVSNIGTCGLFVDGVPLFNTGDTFSYDTSAGGDQEPTNNNQGDGYWNRDAFTNEGVSFDAGNAHQAMEAFHYHASPTALRSTLGDSVDYDSTVVYEGIGGASPYSENFNGNHSPIIAWVNDGLPMYGPYGYSDPSDATSGVRRMISGYQKRDGSNGSTDLATTGRTTLPLWSVDQGVQASTTIASSLYGPDVSTAFTIGHYQEDYEFKGLLTADASGVAFQTYSDAVTQGEFDATQHYDLNAYNVRFCVTPEFPDGTWAYFTSVEADGTPSYPYNLAFHYFGDPTLASGATELPADVTVVFDGVAAEATTLEGATLDGDTVSMIWNGVEGGTYELTESTDLQTWSAPYSYTAESQFVIITETSIEKKFYTIERTGLAAYDTTEFSTATGGGGGGGGPGDGGGGATPGTGTAAEGFVFSFTGGPPMEALISNLQVGGVTGTVVSYDIEGPTGGTITISFDDSSFSSAIGALATFIHTPPGETSATAISSNSYVKP